MRSTKICQRCGRLIEWRKKWESCWDEVRFCSARCRRRKPSKIDQQFEQAILSLLATRPRGATICPSEAIHSLILEKQLHDHMEQARQAARRLVAQGQIEILLEGQTVDPSTAKGPIRLRKV